MKKILILISIAAAAFGGWWLGRHPHTSAASLSSGDRKVLYYQSPMHPWVKSDKPGRCTICGMELSPIYEGAKGFDADSPLIILSKDGVVTAGVETAAVARAPIRRTIHVAGMIDDDETKHRKISATVDGRVEKLFVNFVGAEVTEGQPLATLYSTMLRTAFAEYQVIAQQQASAQREKLLASVRDRLLRLGLAPADIDSLRDKPSPPSELKILAPATGTVVVSKVYAGQYVKEGDVLFEIGDFSKMWFVFDAYERDLTWMKMGDEVEITTEALPGKVLKAPIVFIDPTINSATRSAKIRVVLDNPAALDPLKHRHQLLHKLFADGRIRTVSEPVLAVPRNAVLWPTGTPLVYVQKSEGAYEPREIELGRAGDDIWEVTAGLKEGEKVVTSGNLLLDSQAQINRPPKAMGTVAASAALTDAQQSAAHGFFDAEARLVDLLSGGKTQEWKPGVEMLRLAVEKLSREFGAAVDPIRKTSNLPVSADVKILRAGFYPLAEATADFAISFRMAHPEFAKLFVFECGMAGGAIPGLPKETGRWVQLTGPIHNPWYGAEMLSCGTEIKP